MKPAIRPALVVLVLSLVILPAIAERARSLYNKGKDAEARQNYEQAYDFYKQSYDQRPQDASYRSAFERLRFLAGASHVHRGQLLREAGRLEEALAEFQKGADIDPSSAIAKQEIQVTNQMIQQAKAPAPQAGPQAPSLLQRRLQEASGPVELGNIPNVPINLKITEDSKVIYETIGKLAGINVLFDPDYRSQRIKVELNSVSLEEALQSRYRGRHPGEAQGRRAERHQDFLSLELVATYGVAGRCKCTPTNTGNLPYSAAAF